MTYYFPLSVDLDRQSGSEMADTGDTKPLGNGTNSHSEFEVTIMHKGWVISQSSQ